MIELSPELNASQREAVLHRDGPLLVIAGAGTGKTRTITQRIHRLIENGGPTPPTSSFLVDCWLFCLCCGGVVGWVGV